MPSARWGHVVNAIPWLLYPQEGKLAPIIDGIGYAPGPSAQTGTNQMHSIDYIQILTLSLLSYIYGAPCKARNFNIVYIWTYV
jgi:hypothetical protein